MRIEMFSRLGLCGKRWYFRVRADNGEIIAASEGYKRRVDARSTAQRLRDGMASASIFCSSGREDA